MTKKMSIVFVAAMVLVFASVSFAYASAISGYATWSSTSPNLGANDTPHRDYQTGTVKCAVCHAVHKAPTGQVLLRSSAADGCTYCHIDSSLSLGQLYNGVATNYTGPNANAHNSGGPSATEVGSRCVDCHSVHGANTMSLSSVSSKILRSVASYNSGASTVGPQAGAVTAYGATNTKDAQVTVFCTMCHPYFQNAHNGTISVGTMHASGGTQSGTFQSHIMAAADNNYAGTGTSYTGKVAWVGSQYCRSCHDAGLVDVHGVTGVKPNSFPHYTRDYTRFMVSRDTSSSAATGTVYVPGNPTGQTDGVCLKCHVEGTEGVGKTY